LDVFVRRGRTVKREEFQSNDFAEDDVPNISDFEMPISDDLAEDEFEDIYPPTLPPFFGLQSSHFVDQKEEGAWEGKCEEIKPEPNSDDAADDLYWRTSVQPDFAEDDVPNLSDFDAPISDDFPENELEDIYPPKLPPFFGLQSSHFVDQKKEGAWESKCEESNEPLREAVLQQQQLPTGFLLQCWRIRHCGYQCLNQASIAFWRFSKSPFCGPLSLAGPLFFTRLS